MKELNETDEPVRSLPTSGELVDATFVLVDGVDPAEVGGVPFLEDGRERLKAAKEGR